MRTLLWAIVSPALAAAMIFSAIHQGQGCPPQTGSVTITQPTDGSTVGVDFAVSGEYSGLTIGMEQVYITDGVSIWPATEITDPETGMWSATFVGAPMGEFMLIAQGRNVIGYSSDMVVINIVP